MDSSNLKPRKISNAWIFISHSNHDLEKVRLVRNELERLGHNPLLFYLKCLSDTDARLPQLIREEIEVREWFVLCESANSKSSNHVAQEVELIKSLKGKVFETIDLSRDLESEFYKLHRLSRRATAFLSYSQADRGIAGRIENALTRHDFGVWVDTSLEWGSSWADEIESGITDAISDGYFLPLLSRKSLASPSVLHEIHLALMKSEQSGQKNVIPLMVEKIEQAELPEEIRDIAFFDLTSGPLDERLDVLVKDLKTRNRA